MTLHEIDSAPSGLVTDEPEVFLPTGPLADASWMDAALCNGMEFDEDLFYNDVASECPTKARRALAICAACPVREQCLSYALETEERYGIWGGTTAKERRQIIGRNRRLSRSNRERHTAKAEARQRWGL